MTRYLSAFGRPTFLLGVNYWSRAGGPRMWEADRWNPELVDTELGQMRQMGLNACRAFLFLPTHMPSPPTVDEKALGRFSDFVRQSEKKGVAVLPSLLVGHMSGENFDFPGQKGRSAYTDPEVVGWERTLARTAAAALAGSPAVTAWVLSNEMPLWGGAAPKEVIAAWTKLLCDEIRTAAPGTKVGTGDGYMNARGGQNGFDPELLAQIVDYLGPHAYPADSDPIRQSLYCELGIRSLQHLGKPVLFEEFGSSSCQAGEAEQALYWRETIHTAMATGAAGAIGWCMNDFDLTSEIPYNHHAFELGFGVVRADGSEKPVAHSLREAGRLVETLDWPSLEPAPTRAALIRPSYLETTYPFSWEERTRMFRSLHESYTLARMAGIEVAVVPESHSLAGFDLLLVPSTQKLLTGTWERLLDRAAEGATVYWSYFGGDYEFHQGMWCHRFEALTGARHRLRYGVPDVPPAEISINGYQLDLRCHTPTGPVFPRSFLPIEPTSAAVIARDQAERPALLRQAIGKGQSFFLTYPWEHYVASQAAEHGRGNAHELYVFLAKNAKAEAAYPSGHPHVQTHHVRAPKEDLVWAFNRGWDPVEAKVDAPEGDGVYAPKEVRVLRVPRT